MPAPQPLVAALGSRYAVGEEIGRGGMATVYAADDLRHDRPVAIKVLSEEASAARGAARFLQEIRVAARLNHPHILPLFDSGEVEGRLYFVMPRILGESLRERLRRDGRLPIDDALRITREIGDALSYAHETGIIHRDVKPENILLSQGHALLADFGIARPASAPRGADALTQTGVIIGTPEYMSPEQLFGDDDVGAASDIYALGCVLFEMLAGAPPHGGVRVQTIIAERMSGRVPAVRAVRPEVSDSMDRNLGRALALDPVQRFKSAREFADALVSGRASEPTIDAARSLIVRPFDTVGDDDELAFFSEGLTEEVIGGLSKARSLRVISRTSAMRLKGTPLDVRAIGREYGVRYIVTGSVRRAAARLRVAAEIVDSLLDTPVWAGRFDGSMDDPFGIQESVAAGVVDALRVSLTPEEQRRMTERPIADPRAYECRRKAMAAVVTFSREGLERAEALLNEGLEIVGDNAQLFAGLGSVHWQYVNAGIDVSDERLAQARHWLDRALALDPGLVDALTTVAWIDGSRGNLTSAFRHLDRALEGDPTHSFALGFHAVLDWISGRHDQMLAMTARLQAIDPWDLWGVVLSGAMCATAGDTAGRDRYLRRAAEISPTPFIEYMRGHILAQGGEADAARTIWSRFADADPEDLGVVFCQAGLAALDGRAADARTLMHREDVRMLTALDGQWGWYAASTYALAGLADEGITMLETAVRQGFSNLPLLETRDATLASLRGDPRFPDILRRAKDMRAALS